MNQSVHGGSRGTPVYLRNTEDVGEIAVAFNAAGAKYTWDRNSYLSNASLYNISDTVQDRDVVKMGP